jgi:hypothetical protein
MTENSCSRTWDVAEGFSNTGIKEAATGPKAGMTDGMVATHCAQGKAAKVGGFPLGVLSRLLTVLRLLYASDGNDYRLAVQRWWRTATPMHGEGRRRGRRYTSS